MFVILGIVLALYVAYAMIQGEVTVKSGIKARTVLRADTPVYYWTCIAVYGLLAFALITVF